ncbi:MAG: tetratricopeptide repeat protein [Candidatus Acidiferrales bacterium]
MKYLALAAVGLFLFAGTVLAHDHSSVPTSPAAPQAAPQIPRTVDAWQIQMADAQDLMATKDYEQAAHIFTTLTRTYPDNYAAWNMLGVALQQLGQIDSARDAYKHATKLNSKFAEAYNNIGTTWYQEQRYGRAIREYRKSIAENPNLASAYSNLGCAYFNEKKYPEAVAAFNKALSIDPDVFALGSYAGTLLQDRSVSDHGTFYFLLAKSYAERNDPADCAQYLRKAFDEGYKNVPAVKTDPSFAKVLADPGVQAIVDKAEANGVEKPPAAPGT